MSWKNRLSKRLFGQYGTTRTLTDKRKPQKGSGCVFRSASNKIETSRLSTRNWHRRADKLKSLSQNCDECHGSFESAGLCQLMTLNRKGSNLLTCTSKNTPWTFLWFLFVRKCPGCAILTEKLFWMPIFPTHQSNGHFFPFLCWVPQDYWLHSEYTIFYWDTACSIEWAWDGWDVQVAHLLVFISKAPTR